jgi:hypothetical protein
MLFAVAISLFAGRVVAAGAILSYVRLALPTPRQQIRSARG